MQINNNSNVNFTARLDLSRVSSNKRMWSNVADMFEAKTKKIPYTFRLDNSCDELVIQADTILKSGYDPEHDVIISKKATEELMAMTPEKIAQKLVKLLNVFKEQDQTLDAGFKFLNKLEKKDKYHTLSDTFDSGKETFFDRIWCAVIDKTKADRYRALREDSIFRNAEFVD